MLPRIPSKTPQNPVHALRAPVTHALRARKIAYATPPDHMNVSTKFGQNRLSGVEMHRWTDRQTHTQTGIRQFIVGYV